VAVEVEGQVTLQRGETYFEIARSLDQAEMRELNVSGPRLGTAPVSDVGGDASEKAAGTASGSGIGASVHRLVAG
jgi:hypothetical protein